MVKPLFTGVCTALVTPMLHNSINFPLLQRLIQRQLDAGIKALVVAGTTGESATLTDVEKIMLIRKAKEYAGDQCMIIAGTGSNSTSHAINLSLRAEAAGADALLVVSPYYNKATPDGLLAHYIAIANAVKIPLIIYNVPSRTGVDIPVSVYKKLSAVANIVGIKEASADITKITKILAACPPGFSVWSGNDDQIVPVISLGGSGVISVLSNLYPFETRAMCETALDGDIRSASQLQQEMGPIIELLFSEVNPIPVKAAMKHIGYDCGECRLPLCAPTEATINSIKKLII